MWIIWKKKVEGILSYGGPGFVDPKDLTLTGEIHDKIDLRILNEIRGDSDNWIKLVHTLTLYEIYLKEAEKKRSAS